MKSEELKSLNIIFVGIISFSLFTTTTYINYHIYASYKMGINLTTPHHLDAGAPLPTPRSEIAGAWLLNGKIYIIGGFDETGQVARR